MRRTALGAFLLLLAACAAPGAVSSDAHLRGVDPERTVSFQTVEDVVSYADAVVVLRVRAERAEPEDAAVRSSGEGMVLRRLTLHVQRLLWTAPAGAQLDAEVETLVVGWWLHDGERTRTTVRDAPSLEVGRSYLAPLVRLDCAWSVVEQAVVGLDAAGSGTVSGRSGTTALARQFLHAGVDGTQALVRSTPANPSAARHRELDPDARLQAALRDQYGLTPPYTATPGRDC